MELTGGTWLCPTNADRQRVIDNTSRVRRARAIASAAVGFTLVFFAPEFGWWTLLLFALSCANMLTLDRRTLRSARPEYHVALSVVWTQGLLAAAIGLSGGPRSFALPWIVIPTTFAAARFRAPVVMAGVATGAAMLIGVCFAVDAHATVAHPDQLIVAIALLVTITACVFAVSGAELEKRGESTLDPLTGLLNRAALQRRFAELAAQAALVNAPISMLFCDIDRFKAINDTYGHARGDDVLRGVADEMRTELRSFELIYRVGGEEFLIVLPGAEEAHAATLAEQLRQGVELARPGELDVTISIGVATARGGEVRYDSLFGAADRALYDAKAAGRNRISRAEPRLARA